MNTQALLDKVVLIKRHIKAPMCGGVPISVSYSGGKDSSVLLDLTLQAAAESVAEGHTLLPIIIATADTRIDNPEVKLAAKADLARAEAFSRQHGFEVWVECEQPTLASSFFYRTIGQGKLPTFVNSGTRSCADDWKVKVLKRLKSRVNKRLVALGSAHPPITLIGSRFEESKERKGRMEDRGECAETPWVGKDGYLYLSPIAHLSSNEVFKYLHLANEREIQAFSPFDEVLEVYESAGGSTCPVEIGIALGEVSKARACGARTGCHQCLAVGATDKSLTNMIDGDPGRYGYMRGLNDLRNFFFATRYDWTRRSWLGRTVNEAGYITVRPDVYSPAMCEELLRYALTIDAQEAERAAAAGESAPRFVLIDLETLIAIDAEWGRQGYHRPFHALAIYREIIMQGARYSVPTLEPVPPQPMPEPRYVFVGREWEDPRGEWRLTGLRDALLESDAFGGPCGVRTRAVGKSGRTVLDLDTAEEFGIDEETIEFILLDMDNLIDRYHDDEGYSITAGYFHYVRLGAITLSPGQLGPTDEILRRTAFRQANGLTGSSPDLAPLLARSISHKEMQDTLSLTALQEAEMRQEQALFAASPEGRTQAHCQAVERAREALLQAWQEHLQAEAFLYHSNMSGESPVFDGRDYRVVCRDAGKQIAAVERKGLLSQQEVEAAKRQVYQVALAVAEGTASPFTFGVAMYLATPSLPELCATWRKHTRVAAGQLDLFEIAA